MVFRERDDIKAKEEVGRDQAHWPSLDPLSLLEVPATQTGWASLYCMFHTKITTFFIK